MAYLCVVSLITRTELLLGLQKDKTEQLNCLCVAFTHRSGTALELIKDQVMLRNSGLTEEM